MSKPGAWRIAEDLSIALNYSALLFPEPGQTNCVVLRVCWLIILLEILVQVLPLFWEYDMHASAILCIILCHHAHCCTWVRLLLEKCEWTQKLYLYFVLACVLPSLKWSESYMCSTNHITSYDCRFWHAHLRQTLTILFMMEYSVTKEIVKKKPPTDAGDREKEVGAGWSGGKEWQPHSASCFCHFVYILC